MKTAMKGALANLVWIALLTGGQALAEQAGSTDERASAGQLKPEPVAEASNDTPPTRLLGELDGPFDSVLSESEMFGPDSKGPCCEVCGGGSCCPPQWYTEQGVRILTRSKTRSNLITREFASSRDADDPTDFTQLPGWQLIDTNTWQWTDFRSIRDIMDSKALAFDVAAGYNMTVGRYLGRDTDNRDHFIELTYWGPNSWDDSTSIRGLLQPSHFENLIAVGINNRGSYVRNPDGQQTFISTPLVFDYRGSLASTFPLEDERPVAGSPEEAALEEVALALDQSFNHVLEHSISYSSTMNNVEINGRIRPRSRADRLVLHPNGKWRRECQPGTYLSYLFGFRFVSIDESFHFRSRGTNTRVVYKTNADGVLEIGPPDPPGYYQILDYVNYNVAGDYTIHTHNDLIGLQLGGDYIHRRCKWSWGVRGKAGPFLNFSEQNSRVTTEGIHINEENPNEGRYVHINFDAVDIRRAAKKNAASLVGEVGFVADYKIRPNLTLRGAYDFLFITGLALAPEQFSSQTNPPNSVNDNGHGYYHGLTLSAEYVW